MISRDTNLKKMRDNFFGAAGWEHPSGNARDDGADLSGGFEPVIEPVQRTPLQ